MNQSIVFILLEFYLVVLCLSSAVFPAPLTKNNFKSVLESGLHLVEFYSPYCSHCKQFAPTWEKTWEDFHDEGSRLGIGMVQVNCVESGDLCNDEKILSYPSIKLYGPDGFIKNYPKSYKRNEADLIKFCKEQVLELGNEVSIPDAQSELISTDKIVQLLASPTVHPYLISFWPSHQLNDINIIEDSNFETPLMEETLSFQRKWKVISNQLLTSDVQTGHFSCLSNLKICKHLGFKIDRPNVGMILPNKVSGKFITYDQDIHPMEPRAIVEFTERVSEISKVPSIDSKRLLELISSSLKPLTAIPQNAETYFVFLYDEETVSQEDFELLPYLTEPLASLPNTHLLQSNDSKILDLVELQKKNIYSAINYNSSQPQREFNEQRSQLESSSTLPTLLCFKQYSILPEVFQSLGPGDIRDQWRVLDWIRENSQQFISELHTETLSKVLKSNTDQKQVIQLIDSNNENLSLVHLNNLIVAYHDYSDLYQDRIFEKIISDRRAKNLHIEKLKSQKSVDQKKVIDALSQEIKHGKKERASLLYLDLSKNSKLIQDLGVRLTSEDFKNGDVITLDRNGRFYYDTDQFGARLSTAESPFYLRETLAILGKVHKGTVRKRLRDSPYGSYFSALDSIHQFGMFGYFFMLIGVFIGIKSGIKILKNFSHLKLKHDSRGLGILDDPTKYE